MPGAVSPAVKLRIAPMALVHVSAVQVREPGLDPPGRHHHGHWVLSPSRRYTSGIAHLVKLAHPGIDSEPIAINHHDKCLACSSTYRPKLYGKPLADKLFSRSA